MGDQIYNLVVKKDKRKISQFNKELLDALTKLKKERDWSLAPTDKTGRWIEAYIPWYIDQMQQKMRENCIEIDINHLEEVHEKALELFNKYEIQMCKGEKKHVEIWINRRDVPTPRLLVKDHKKIGKDGYYPTRLVIPANSFTQVFGKMRYLLIKSLFDMYGVEYNKYTILQAKSLKEDLEKKFEGNINKKKDILAALDIEAMYPSIKYKLIEKAVLHYCKKAKLSEADMERVRIGLEMLKFSISNC